MKFFCFLQDKTREPQPLRNQYKPDSSCDGRASQNIWQLHRAIILQLVLQSF